MVRKRIVGLEDEKDLISEFIEKKKMLDQLKKEVEQLSSSIKTQMSNNNQKVIERNGYKLTYSSSERINWNEEKLLNKVKGFGIPELIQTFEQVNMAFLEQCVLDEIINVDEINECSTVKKVETLRISKCESGS